MEDGPAHDDAQNDDEDLRSDPVAEVDMGVSPLNVDRGGPTIGSALDPISRADLSQQHIRDTLARCYASNVNGMHEMIGALTEGEKAILRSVLTL
jgi:hypothetical protein